MIEIVLVLALPVLLARRDLLRDEVDAELRQPLSHGGRIRAPLGLVERQHCCHAGRHGLALNLDERAELLLAVADGGFAVREQE